MRGNRFSRSACAIALVAFLAGYAPDTKADIVGHWQLVDEKHAMSIEFKEDGTYVAQTAVGRRAGRWELVDPSHIATWSNEGKPKRVSEFAIVGNFLIIIGAQGSALKHKRITLENSD